MSRSIEERLSNVEEAVRELKAKLENRKVDPNWLEKMTGVFENDPVFDEIVRLGREAREADRPQDEEPTP